jgi:[acyl-carrier-protein] S-malonyltransferase
MVSSSERAAKSGGTRGDGPHGGPQDRGPEGAEDSDQEIKVNGGETRGFPLANFRDATVDDSLRDRYHRRVPEQIDHPTSKSDRTTRESTAPVGLGDCAVDRRFSEVWLFPGLGCRYVGMGSEFLGQEPAADELVRQASDLLGYSVEAVCLEGSGRKVVPPRQESEVIYVISCAAAAVLRSRGWHPSAVLGHSLGSWAAVSSSGVLDFATGLRLLSLTEQRIHDWVESHDHAMGVILGLEASMVAELVAAERDVWVANWNSPRQQVISGMAPGVERVLAEALARQAKQARVLVRSRAMHTPFLEPVAQALRTDLAQLPLREPQVPVIDTRTGHELRGEFEVAEFLADCLTAPVHWGDTILSRLQRGATGFIDVGPGTVLAGMLPFIDNQAAVMTTAQILEHRGAT